MALASYEFLILFFPLTLLAYYLLFKTPRAKMFFLLAASYLFYGLAGWQFIPVLAGLSLVTFFAAKKQWTLAGALANLGALLFFKYWNFGADNLNAIFQGIQLGALIPIIKLGLPLGLSFFVFKHIGYLLDIEQKRYPASDDLWAFATYSAYFPQISAGPISSYKETASQFSQLPEKLSREALSASLVQFSWGLIKKVLIADALSAFLVQPLANITNFEGFLPAWYIVIAYSMQLYFDFSGYTDMTLGLSGLLGIKLPGNFNSPYLAANVGEFWERWHMSLSKWFRFYLFSPLSRSFLKSWGSERRELAQYTANLLTMTLVGLWHGAGWSYILWGVYHGIQLNLNAWWKRTGRTIPVYIEKPLFLLTILLGWALFMSPNPSYIKNLALNLIGWNGLGWPLFSFWLEKITTSVLATAIFLAFSGIAEAENLYAKRENWHPAVAFVLGILAALAIFFLQKTTGFIYVQF